LRFPLPDLRAGIKLADHAGSPILSSTPLCGYTRNMPVSSNYGRAIAIVG
jgi:hypothetical protein